MVIPTKHYRTEASEIWIDDEGIMHVVFDKGADLTLERMKDAFRIYKNELDLGPGRRQIPQVLSGGPVNINKEARDYAGKRASQYFTAAAMVTESPLMRLIVNTFNAIQKPGIPFKLFAREDEAMEWLRRYK